jgi:hypothetical protein
VFLSASPLVSAFSSFLYNNKKKLKLLKNSLEYDKDLNKLPSNDVSVNS